MDEMTQMQNQPLFKALLTPHRALGPTGIRRVVAFYAVLTAIPGLYFFLAGAWPIVGFLGLDALALWWALTANQRSGRAFEEVTLWPDRLDISQTAPSGTTKTHAFNPFWVRLDIKRDFEERVTRLALKNRGDELEIGSFLNPDDKASFAVAFGQALSHSRR